MKVVNVVTIDRQTIENMNKLIDVLEKHDNIVTGFEISVGKTFETSEGKTLDNDYIKPIYHLFGNKKEETK